MDDLCLSLVGFDLPVVEVDLLEELGLVVLEFSHYAIGRLGVDYYNTARVKYNDFGFIIMMLGGELIGEMGLL